MKMHGFKFINKKQDFIAYLLLIITAIIWGGTWPLGRWLVAVEVGGPTIPPLMIASIRYFLAIICFFVILKIREGTLNWNMVKMHWKIIIFMGLTSVVIYQIGYLLGEIFTSASDASILVATNAIWVIILSRKFLKTEYLSWKTIFGTFLAFAAVILVVGFSPNSNVLNRILGDVLILMAAFLPTLFFMDNHVGFLFWVYNPYSYSSTH
jgi:drug/metabolite transporter (DMT)-like permease